AYSTERDLFEKHELMLERIPDLVVATRTREGAQAAMDLVADWVPFTQHERLIEVLIETVKELGDAEKLAELEDLQTRAAAARTRLEELREQEEARAKAKAEAER
ncbi:MAG: hypothetical protein KDB61_16895, partial [Planctomycetes bacterium]|nr:hypothetical protein [Planctomycetota bacterium]